MFLHAPVSTFSTAFSLKRRLFSTTFSAFSIAFMHLCFDKYDCVWHTLLAVLEDLVADDGVVWGLGPQPRSWERVIWGLGPQLRLQRG